MMEAMPVVFIAICAFYWGDWYAERRATKKVDVGVQVLACMMRKNKEARQFVGDHAEVKTSFNFDMGDDVYIVSLATKPRKVEAQ